MCKICIKIGELIKDTDNLSATSVYIPKNICRSYKKDKCEKLDNQFVNFFFRHVDISHLPISVYPGIKEFSIRTSAYKIKEPIHDYIGNDEVEIIIPAHRIFEIDNDVCLTINIKYNLGFRLTFIKYYVDVAMVGAKEGVKKTIKFLCDTMENGLSTVSDTDWSMTKAYILRTLNVQNYGEL